MQDHQVSQLIGPGKVMCGTNLALDDVIARGRQAFPGRSICVVGNWFWLDLEAPRQVMHQMAGQSQQPVMLLALDILYSSSGSHRAGEWLRSTPLLTFTDEMYFRTQHIDYVLVGSGRRLALSLSTVLQLFSSEQDGH